MPSGGTSTSQPTEQSSGPHAIEAPSRPVSYPPKGYVPPLFDYTRAVCFRETTYADFPKYLVTTPSLSSWQVNVAFCITGDVWLLADAAEYGLCRWRGLRSGRLEVHV
jgi:hypothetical protein